MEHGVCNGRVHPDNTELTDPLDAQRIYRSVRFRQHDDLDRTNVRVHGNQVFAQFIIGVRGTFEVDFSLLEQRGRNPPDHTAHQLASGGHRIDDGACGIHAERTRDPDLARAFVHAHFDKLGAERGPNLGA